MHPEAYANAQRFYAKYAKTVPSNPKVVDFGSYDVNGTLRPIFTGCSYTGLDMQAGPNVDVVSTGDKTPFDTESVDIVVSSSNFEHDDCFWMTFLEMCRIIKPGGLVYINAPSAGPYHGYPGDCFRFYKDSWAALAKWACKKDIPMVLEESYVDLHGMWKDSVGIFRKSAATQEASSSTQSTQEASSSTQSSQ
jgi:SAM-dependent methyltransferase